ncbi:MAG: GNAT family N-acetyltransferase [Candidatus Hodarchaeota archaeon]
MKICYLLTPQMKMIRELEPNLDDTGRLADCFNTWSDDDSWGGGFGSTKITAERILNDFFAVNLVKRMVVVDQTTKEHLGFCSVDNHWTDYDTMYIPLLGVSPTHQKKNYGKSLLLKALQTAIEHKKRRIDLHTWAGNLRAVPVYKKTGFKWCPKTSVLMENFLPAILTTPFFESFFIENDWYYAQDLKITQKHDEFEYHKMKAYFYRFVQDEQNSLEVRVDRHAKELSGFSYVVNGKKLDVQLVTNQHEIFVGINQVQAELRVKNEQPIALKIEGALKPFKKHLKVLSSLKIDTTIQPDEEMTIPMNFELNSDIETYLPDQKPWKRTDCRFYCKLQIDGKTIQLALGWVPKEAIQVIITEPSVYFGKYIKEKNVPIGFRNMTTSHLQGTVVISGDGLDKPQEFIIDTFDAGSAFEKEITLFKPKEALTAALRWTIEFASQDPNIKLPPIIRHIGCFAKPGAIAYVNPRKEAIIENDLFRFRFQIDELCELTDITSKYYTENSHTRFFAFGIGIGKPFPEESSEFWRLERPYEVVHRETGVSFKQTVTSKTEKPGLQVTRWIEVDAGKPYISCYCELTNTGETLIKDVAIRTRGPWNIPDAFLGSLVLPLNKGWISSDDPEFNDRYDYPYKASDFDEPWLAREPHNGIGLGFGQIWDPKEVDTIKGAPTRGHIMDTVSYDLKPGETINIGHLTYVFGQLSAQITRNIWLNEFNVNKSKTQEPHELKLIKPIFELQCGEELAVPDLEDSPLPLLNWINLDSKNIPIRLLYQGKRETPVDIEAIIESPFWVDQKKWLTSLETGKNGKFETNLPIEKLMKKNGSKLYQIKGTMRLPYTTRPFASTVLPYRESGKVNLITLDDRWIFTNGLLTFETSPTHGGSLFSARLDQSMNLFFSRFPNRESFVWFKRFIGGFNPYINIPNVWDWMEFYDNAWLNPILIEEKNWVGLQYHLPSPTNDFRLNNIASTVTYYTRADSPIIWGQLKVTNNSGKSTSINGGFSLFLQPIQEMVTKRSGAIWIGSKTEREKSITTTPPDNWVIASFGKNQQKIIFTTMNPSVRVKGDYMNANGYSNFYCNKNFKLRPGESMNIDVALIFNNSNSTKELLTIFDKKRDMIQL